MKKKQSDKDDKNDKSQKGQRDKNMQTTRQTKERQRTTDYFPIKSLIFLHFKQTNFGANVKSNCRKLWSKAK